MLRFLIFSVIILVPILAYPHWPLFDQVECDWVNGPYKYCPPPPNIMHTCNNSEWICPKDPRKNRDYVAVPSIPGAHLTVCDYDEQCSDVNKKPRKCCYDSATNTRICKPALKRDL